MAELIGQQLKDPLMAKIVEIIEPSINALGFELVRVSMTGRDHNILQIMADRRMRKAASMLKIALKSAVRFLP